MARRYDRYLVPTPYQFFRHHPDVMRQSSRMGMIVEQYDQYLQLTLSLNNGTICSQN